MLTCINCGSHEAVDGQDIMLNDQGFCNACEGKKTFRVYARSVEEFYVDVHAKNEEEARDIANSIDGSEFTPTNEFGGDWSIDEAEPIEHDPDFKNDDYMKL